MHNPTHRLGVAYPNGGLNRRFGGASQAARMAAGRSGNWHRFGEANIGTRNSFRSTMSQAGTRNVRAPQGSSSWQHFQSRQSDRAPAQRYQAPAQRYQAPAQRYQAPAQRYQAPAQRYQAPAQRYQAPAQRYQAPAQRYQAPAQRYQAPAQRYQAPAQRSFGSAPRMSAPSFRGGGSFRSYGGGGHVNVGGAAHTSGGGRVHGGRR